MISKVHPVVTEVEEKKEWFETWFDSPYYHILYKHRDHKEAELFLDNLINHLHPSANAKILDVACGRGRHSIYLNRKGFDVCGFDLSENNIQFDKSFENDKLQFFLHDMREVFRANYFDFVLNLFSSFGYFSKERDNLRCMIANATALKPGGFFVFDYFNSEKILFNGNTKYEEIIDGVNFNISKEIKDQRIFKYIEFTDKGINYRFAEEVLMFTADKLRKFINDAGLTIFDTFGDYQLNPFDAQGSDRFIIIAKK